MSSLLSLVSEAVLLDLALKSAAVMFLAVVAVALLGRASAAWRHLVWSLSVASLLLLPIVSLMLPDWRVAWLPQWTAKPTQRPAMGKTDLAQADRTEPHGNAALVLPASAGASEPGPRKAPHNPLSSTRKSTVPPRAAMPWLAITWPAAGLLSLVPLAIGLWQLAGLHRRSRVICDHRWLTLLDELRRQLAVRRSVQLRQCESALGPLTWGALRPVLLLPFEADGWPNERRRLVLLHELAHVRRWDWLTQLVAHVACAVYWFNPLVWLAARQMQIERERACDDMVLASGVQASDYARELLALAAGLSDSQVSTFVAVPMSRRRSLDDRLDGILDGRRSRAALTGGAICLGTVLAAAAMTPLAMLRAAPPELTESEPAEPKKEPPTAPIVDSGSVGGQAEDVDDDHRPRGLTQSGRRQVGGQAEDVDDDHGPPALDDPEIDEVYWDLTIEETVRTALANAKVLRNLGGRLFTPVVPQSNLNHAASQRNQGSAQDRKAIPGMKVRLVLVRINDDIALVDFEAGVRNLVSDLERAYWDLYYNYRNFSAAQAGRDSALATWRRAYALWEQGVKVGKAEKVAQAREQYFLFRAQAENSLGLLYTAESRLRNMMGLAPSDGRRIRPSNEPTTEEVHFVWNEVLRELLNHNRSKDQEPELVHQMVNAIRDVDRNYQVSVTTFNRRMAAERQVDVVQAAVDAGTATLDILLDAQRRLADAEIAYYRALVDYNVAILQVHYRKGSLLERNGILLAERARAGFDTRKK